MSAVVPQRYREIEVSGRPREMGRQIGEAAGEEIRGFCAIALERVNNDDPATGFWQTVFSVMMEPEEGRMHVSRGTPCEHPYETYCLG